MPKTARANWRDIHGDRFDGKRILVTGGAGFIGSHLIRALSELGASVVVLDDLSGGARENIDGVHAVEFEQASILDRAALERCMSGCKLVFHLAALGSVPRSVAHPRL